MKIETIPNYRMAYVRQVGPYGPANKQAMERIKSWAADNNLLNDKGIYGIPQDNPAETEPEQCRYDACIVIPDDFQLEEGMNEGELAGGEYAVYKVEHTAEAIQKAWVDSLEGLHHSEYQIDHKPVIERYRQEMVSSHFCEICVPVKRKDASTLL
ncbi:AraC family transcriptional regulator [Lysinibacillus odysseyi]|uniref:DNA gyrase inhibitor n=2 Tax=Lysinibacillus odysseyi TaxID=202611 RepID=A0A0A3INM7_9BACI|nr:GyrI-like domain-containing protein [Lysinibacillus odysseyi]KGR84433.1 DNA gyrase inhibitor [Lysinibacillus odysseyi 34hs-1 = NBRC 100172]